MALLNCNFCSATLGMNTQLTVLLPERRHKPRKLEQKKYPVIYCLHGLGQDNTNWQRDGILEHLLKEQDVIVAMPNCNKSFYVNGRHGYEYFTYLTEELPIIMANYFPASTRREDTFIAGISMGGYGALHAALLRPDLYAAAASLSGAVEPLGAKAPIGFYSCRDHERNLIDLFGNSAEYRSSREYLPNALQDDLAKGKKLPRLYMTCGKQDFLYDLNIEMRDCFKKSGVDLAWEEYDGIHTWDYWNKVMPNVLSFFGFSSKPFSAGSMG